MACDKDSQAASSFRETAVSIDVAVASDFLLQVMTGGTDDYDRLLIEKLYRLPGVHDVRSNFALRTIKDERQLPV